MATSNLKTGSDAELHDSWMRRRWIREQNSKTKVSCDNTSNYIYVDMSGFMPERYYRLQLKLTDGFTTQYIDCDTYFKIVR